MFIQVRAFESKNSLILNLIEVKTAFGSTSNPFLFMKYPIYVWNGKFCILWVAIYFCYIIWCISDPEGCFYPCKNANPVN